MDGRSAGLPLGEEYIMEDGTIVHVDYDLYNAETGDLIETTREEVAKEHEKHQEGRTYSPLVCAVGAGTLIAGFEDALSEAKANKDTTVEISAEDAYGEKDPTQIETISIDKLLKHVRDPQSLYLGAPVNISGRQGYLAYLSAGRARIDYNHPMAGMKLKYDFKIVKVIEDREEKIAALLESNTGHTDFVVEMDGDDVSITIPQTMLFDTNAALMKFRLVTTLRDSVEVNKVTFMEVHEPRGFGASDEEE